MSRAACGAAAEGVCSWAVAAEQQSPRGLRWGWGVQPSVRPYLSPTSLWGLLLLASWFCCERRVCLPICAHCVFFSLPFFPLQNGASLNWSQCHRMSCWIIKSSRFAAHCTSLIHLLEEQPPLSGCGVTCCSCLQSVNDQNVMVGTLSLPPPTLSPGGKLQLALLVELQLQGPTLRCIT